MQQPELEDFEKAVWVTSDVSVEGMYLIAVHYGPDRSVSLDRVQARRYAVAAVKVAARAEYAAAVLAQLAHIGIDDEAARVTVGELTVGTWEAVELADGVKLAPLVASRNRKPYVILEVDGERITQWSMDEIHGHAMNVLRVRACVDLDARYKQYLTTELELADNVAAGLVGELARHRQEAADDA